jgi:hypothetical protein
MNQKSVSCAVLCAALSLGLGLLGASLAHSQAARQPTPASQTSDPSTAADWAAPPNMPKSPRVKFLEDCAARTIAHDPTVFDQCYTPDFRLSGSIETHYAPNRTLVGRNAVNAKMVWGTGDKNAFKSLNRYILYYIEDGDRIAYHRRFVAVGPRVASYAGVTNIAPDLKLEMDALEVITFRDSKIASEFWTYDTLGFVMDLAGGDPQKVAASLVAMKPFLDQIKSGEVAPPSDLSSPSPAPAPRN